MKEKVLIALSGGVDSAVAGYLLKKKGYELFGVYIRMYDNEETHKQNLSNIERVSEYLKIGFDVLDRREQFYKKVYYPFVQTYIRGQTPNPCIICNRYFKFGELIKFAQMLGIKYLATGHYAKISNGFIEEAKDTRKDQSYFLFYLKKSFLKKIIFPLGDMFKEEVLDTAKSIEPLKHIAMQKESNEICFVEKSYIDILRNFTDVDKEGAVINYKGKIIGKHKGYMHYTVGKRRGFTVFRAKTPYYVLKILPKENKIVVGKKEELKKFRLQLKNLNMFIKEKEFDAEIKIRYRSSKIKCKVKIEGGFAKIKLLEPAYAIASGQAGVFYKDKKVIGGGWIV